MINFVDTKLINQLNNVGKKADKDTTVTPGTRRRWEQNINKAFEELGIDKFKYLNAKTEQAKQKQLKRASKTLAKHLERENKRREKAIIHEKKQTEKLRKEVMNQAKQSLQEHKDKVINAQTGERIGVSKSTQHFLYERGLLPELSDIANLQKEQLIQAQETMQIPMTERADQEVKQYTRDYLERYFSGLLIEPGTKEIIEELVDTIGRDYTRLNDLMEYTQDPSFKGGYGDTKEMLKNNSNADISDEMYDRLERLANVYGIDVA